MTISISLGKYLLIAVEKLFILGNLGHIEKK